jgi:glycosyltransferase involved in cell wall biosynthesis
MLEPWAWQYKAWKKRIAWYLFQYRDLQKTHVLHATAPSEAMNLREFFPKIPIVTIPLGVEFPPSLETSSSTSNQRTVLFLSRIHEKKGLLNLMEAWSRLNTESWKLIVAGPDEGGYRTVVEQKAIQLGIIDDIQFTGAVEGEAKWNLYREADLFVLPSFSENFGIVVAEALASSTPAIVTKGAPWSDLKSYQCGWWIDIGISPLVEALREAMAMSQAQRTEMGQRGRKLVESKYTWQRAAEQMLDVYEWMLGRKQKPVSIVD